ncbi:unnamed protein product [Colias eurytheme]|nr:unnamed protein product [Colias eurytheme]
MSVSVSDEKKVDLDDVLNKFGIFKKYHRQKLFLLFIAFASNSLYCNQFIFITEPVQYRCKEDDFNQSVCSSNSSDVCTEWIYEDTGSFVATFDLACQDWKRTLVGSAHNFGYMVGLLIVGPMSDRFGRKAAIVATGVLGGIIGVLRSFTLWYWVYVALEFLEACIGDICSPAFVLSLEIVAKKKRLLFNMLGSLGYAVGGTTLGLVAWLVPSWRWLLRTIYTPALLFIFYIFLLDESPRWHLSNGRKEKAAKILEKAAATNKIKIDQNMLDNLNCEVNESTNFKEVVIGTLKSSKLRTRFFVCLVWWTTSTFVNYGMVLNSISLQGNKYLNFALTQIIDIPGLFFITYVLVRFKRKKPLMFCFAMGAALCLSQPFIPTDLPWLSITFYMAGKLMSSFYFNITYLYTSELFPTYTRNSMHALCSSLGRVGSLVAQQTPLLTVYWVGLPAFVFGSASLFAGLVTLLVPDVSDDSLPDNVKQAEALGMKEKKAVL